jgi:hypothetical protein
MEEKASVMVHSSIARRAGIVAVCLLGLVTVGAASGARTAHRSAAKVTGWTIYSQTKSQQFLDHADDRSRGLGNNPFGTAGDSQIVTNEAGNGPFPGDNAYFSFRIYSDPLRTKRIGSATYACSYNFNKNAYCEVQYAFKDGTIVGGGAFSFNSYDFPIAIQGGTGKYEGAGGQVEVTSDPSALRNQVLRFRFTRL